jgi:hypothetical protein
MVLISGIAGADFTAEEKNSKAQFIPAKRFFTALVQMIALVKRRHYTTDIQDG